jgi:predicted MFS family arabinose efflux permease
MSIVRRWEYRHTVLALCVLAYFGIRFIEFALSLVFPDIVDALGTSILTIGVAVTASTLTYAVAQLPSGALGDRFGERTVVLGALGLTGIGGLLMSAAPTGGVVVLGMALVGAVSGAYYSPATTLLTDLFEGPGHGRAIGVHRIGAQVVGLTGPVVAFVAAAYGWRTVPLLAVAVVLSALVGFGLFVRSRPPTRPDTSIRERVRPSNLADLLSRPDLAFTTAVAGFGQFVDTASFSFLPYLLRAYHGLSAELAGALFTLYFVAVAVSQPAAGWLADRFGRDAIAIVALGLGAVGYLSLLPRAMVVTTTVAIVLVGFGMGWSPPVQSRAIDRLPAADRSLGFGLVRTVYIALAGLCGIVVGGAVTVGGWASAISILAIVTLVPTVALGANATFDLGL